MICGATMFWTLVLRSLIFVIFSFSGSHNQAPCSSSLKDSKRLGGQILVFDSSYSFEFAKNCRLLDHDFWTPMGLFCKIRTVKRLRIEIWHPDSSWIMRKWREKKTPKRQSTTVQKMEFFGSPFFFFWFDSCEPQNLCPNCALFLKDQTQIFAPTVHYS